MAALALGLLSCDDRAGTDLAGETAVRDLERTRGEAVRRPSRSEGVSQGRANLVLITLDTARADAFGVYGQTLPTSPAIDRMAREGVLFDDVTSASPSTLPSHATILTGLLPIAHGVRSNTGYVLSEQETTLAEILAGRGYVTAAEIAAPVIGRETGLAQGFAAYREPGDFDIERKQILLADVSSEEGRRRIEVHERDGADITRRGLEFVAEARKSGQPFFLWLHYFDPHVVYQARSGFHPDLDASPYHEEIRYVDHQVGRILDALREGGLRERTLVVLTADHGEGLGEHDEQTHSFFVYDSTLRVPLVLWGPQSVPRGRRVKAPVRTADIVPTVLDWLRLPSPPGIQGRSLRPFVTGRTQPGPPAPGYAESIEPLALFGTSMLRSLRVGPWKYIHKLEPELYRVDEDPGELRNRAADHPERLEEMRQRLVAFVREGGRDRQAREELDATRRAQLQALGYLGIESPGTFSDGEDIGTVRGPDPVRSVGDFDAFLAAHRALFEDDPVGAAALFRELLDRHPDSVAIRLGWLEALLEAERWSELVPVAQAVLADDPTHGLAAEGLGMGLARLGRLEEAEAHWRRAADRFPCHSDMTSRLALFLAEQGREVDRVESLEAALERCPRSGPILNDLAWARATSKDESLRQAAAALRLAKAAVASEGGVRPDFLDTLACAQAGAGDLEGALQTLDRAFRLLRLRDYPDALVAGIEAHRRSFESGSSGCGSP